MVFGKDYSQAYDYLYSDKDYKKECDFLEDIFDKYRLKVKTILDLGCGTGGHALILAKRGYEVIGVDRSKYMLNLAKGKARKTGLTIDFIRQDIAQLDLRQRFDAIISMFTVINYQITNADIFRICKVAQQHLAPGGVFIFHSWNGSAVLNQEPTSCIKEIQLNEKEKIIRFSEPFINRSARTVEVKFKLLMIRNNHTLNESNESHLLRYLFPQEIKKFLERVGFKDIEFCPFLELGKTLTEKDWNMAVIARN